ncbi:MAG: Bax inhibitor-1/YccA family protein [Vicinamibacteria bacterium]|nr:Bax inhibitor-1/YccA family protein [Vicinamibacteria bacterium]
MLRSGNPTLGAATFTTVARAHGEAAMTISGTVHKTGISLLILVFFAALTWKGVFGYTNLAPTIWIGLGGGFVFALVTVFKKEWAPATTPAYAALEGLMLGGVSLLFNLQYPGIVLNAVGLTLGILVALLFAYRSRLIRATEKFKLGVFAATGGVALVYLVSIGMSFFGARMPLIHESGLIGIGFSLFVVVIAALNLVLDFDFIERGAEVGAPKYMEWYGAFGLLVTLVWLYLEILRLLAKLQGRGRR